jgi:hypothetical protein
MCHVSCMVCGSNRFFELQSPATAPRLEAAAVFPGGHFSESMRAADTHVSWGGVTELRAALARAEGENRGGSSVPSVAVLHCDDYDSSSLMHGPGGVGGEVGGLMAQRVEELVPGAPLAGWLLVAQEEGEGEEGECVSVLGRYCQEGNNVGDAVQLAALAAQAVGLSLHDSSSSSSSSSSLPGGGEGLSVPRSWASLLGPPLSLSSASMF